MERKPLVAVIVLCALVAGTAAGYSARPVKAKAAAHEFVGVGCVWNDDRERVECYGMTEEGYTERLYAGRGGRD